MQLLANFQWPVKFLILILVPSSLLLLVLISNGRSKRKVIGGVVQNRGLRDPTLVQRNFCEEIPSLQPNSDGLQPNENGPCQNENANGKAYEASDQSRSAGQIPEHSPPTGQW